MEFTTKTSNKMIWIGRVLSIIPVLMLFLSASMKFIKPAGFAEGLVNIGWKEEQMFVLGFVEIACAIIYLIPQTSIMGAILLTAYLGGATATHARVGEQFFGPIIFACLIWLGLWFRNGYLREIAPITPYK